MVNSNEHTSEDLALYAVEIELWQIDTSKPALRFNVLSQPTENGIDAEGVEPDARKYKCEFCGEKAVFGAKELIFFLEA